MAELQFNLLGQSQEEVGTLKGSRICKSEIKEARKVISFLQSFVPPVSCSLLCQHDTFHFCQLLCPDPFCDMCKSTTSEVHWLLFLEALEDATPCVITLAASWTLYTSTPFLRPLLLHDIKKGDPIAQPEAPLPLNTLFSLDTMFSKMSTSYQQEQDIFHLLGTHFWGDSATKHKEASRVSFLDLNIQAVLERQMKNRMPFQILEKKEKEEGPFSKQMWSEHQWISSVNSLQPFDVQGTTVPKTGWNVEGKQEHLCICQQLHCLMCLGENLHQKYIQLFWGLPSLHSESLVATLLVSSSTSPLESHFVLFNGLCNASAIKMEDQEVLLHPHSHHFPHPSIYSQPLPQTPSQSQPLPFTQVNPQAHHQSCLPLIPSYSSSRTRDCGVFLHRSKNELDSPIMTENQHLAWFVLKKHQESLWGVVPGFPESQEVVCPQALNLPLVSRSSHACVPVSILPGHLYVTREPQKKLEFHGARKVSPRWCLNACRNLHSLAMLELQCKLTEMSQPKG
ncbi:spermatogenesis-associated protein 31D3-like [Crocuta crocuta]